MTAEFELPSLTFDFSIIDTLLKENDFYVTALTVHDTVYMKATSHRITKLMGFVQELVLNNIEVRIKLEVGL